MTDFETFLRVWAAAFFTVVLIGFVFKPTFSFRRGAILWASLGGDFASSPAPNTAAN